MRAFWDPHDFSEDLGLHAWALLTYIAFQADTKPISVNELSKILKMRWSTVDETMRALEESGFLIITKVRGRLFFQIKEPKWMPEPHENSEPG